MIILFFLALSIVVSYAMGGRARNLSQLNLRFGALVVIALLLKLSLLALGHPFNASASIVVLIAHTFTYLLMATFLIVNLRIDGMKIITFGLALSFASVFSSNGFMLRTESAYASMAPVGPAASTIYPLIDTSSLGSLIVGFGVFLMVSRLLLAQEEQVNTIRIKYQPKHLAKRDQRVVALRRIV